MLKFLKNWTLPVAMLTGIIGYPLFIRLTFLTPALIFTMLLLAFSNVTFAQLKPKPLHLKLLLVQLIGSAGAYLLLYRYNSLIAQAIMICILCPTATSAAVITAKLGGNAASLTTYTLLSNITLALIVPGAFPLIGPHPEITFWESSSVILIKVFILLICPCLLTRLLQKFIPQAHRKLQSLHSWAFYLWAFALAIVTSQILSALMHHPADLQTNLLIALGTLIVCSLQFFLGKTLGTPCNDRIAGGQALGQKNTILAIWMAHTYLNPLSAIGPGFYVLWQNMINSWQLWKQRR